MAPPRKNNEPGVTLRTTNGNSFYGLINQGSTCYLNSVLQVLFMNEEFREAVKRHSGKNNDETHIDRQLSELFDKLSKGIAETVGITNKLRIQSVYKQSDAAEYFEKILTLTNPEASRIFRGQLEHMTECHGCGHKAYEQGSFWHLPLTLPVTGSDGQGFSVLEGLDELFKKSELSGENQLYCDRCHSKCDSTIECNMKEHPDILTLLLKRFEFNYNYMSYTKNNCVVDVPHSLDVPQGPTYELCAFVEHGGSLKGGHYTATIKSQDDRGAQWYNFNDSRVVGLDRNNLNLDEWKSPYLVFYKKIKHDPNTKEPSTNRSTTENHNPHSAGKRGRDGSAKRPPVNRNMVTGESGQVAPESDKKSSKQGARKLGSPPRTNAAVNTGEDDGTPTTNKKGIWHKGQRQQKQERIRRKLKPPPALNVFSRLAGFLLRKSVSICFLCITVAVLTYIYIANVKSGPYAVTHISPDHRGAQQSGFNDSVVVGLNHNHSHFNNGLLKDDPNTREPSTNSPATEKHIQRRDAVKTGGGKNATGEGDAAEVVSLNINDKPLVNQIVGDKSSSTGALSDRRDTQFRDDGGFANQSSLSHRATEGRGEKRSGNIPSAHDGKEEIARRNTTDKEREMRGAANVDQQEKKRTNVEAETSRQKSLKDQKNVEVDVNRESASDRVVDPREMEELIAKQDPNKNVSSVKEGDKMKGKNQSGQVAPGSDEESSKQGQVDSPPRANAAVKTGEDDGIQTTNEEPSRQTEQTRRSVRSLTTRNDGGNQSDDPCAKTNRKKSHWFSGCFPRRNKGKKDKNKKTVKMEKKTS